MSSSINPLMVNLADIQKVFGSKNKALLNEIIQEHEIDDEDTDPDDYEEDEQDEDDDFDVDEIDALPSSQEALAHIIMGEPWARGIGSKYGYMFMEICQHLGERLDCDNWCETRAEFVTAFDKILKKLKVPEATLCLEKLLFGGGPFPLPPRGDAPFLGTLTAAQAADAAKVLAAVDREELNKASQNIRISRGAIDSDFVMDSFEELQSWCETCAAAKKDLIVFYY